jgi:hypothetical protein
MNRLMIALKATHQLGIEQVGLYAFYKLGLLTGYYKRVTDGRRWMMGESPWSEACRPLFTLPARADILAVLGSDGPSALLSEADAIVEGKVRLFGADSVDLKLTLPGPLAHWTAYETGRVPLPDNELFIKDIKFLWEPTRFGWVFSLGRAYHLTADERYPAAFWRNFEIFCAANPPCHGPHWMSGQEVALRMMAFAWAGQVFDAATISTPERKHKLALSVAAHAARIPPTLIYARSQHNNHLLTEAAGLLTAGLCLPDHPQATRWRTLGWRWLNQGLQSQIDGYGEYSQHSTNYQRLMLQVVLWINAIISNSPDRPTRWPRQTLEAVKRSIHWLLSLLDFESGQAPNLGANDGAYIFPLTVLPFSDYRPVLHAGARAFLDYDLPHGPWDEMALWFGAQAGGARSIALPRYLGDQLYGRKSWAYFRTAQFNSRPSHADQLHLDLWWRGQNVTRDAGTYLYNAPAPWTNSLTMAFLHNTVTVNARDQMKRAGRFLYLDWVNAYRKPLPTEEGGELQRVRGRYWGGGFRHTRIVSIHDDDRWQVIDELLPSPWHRHALRARLHWLLPDWDWEIEEGEPLFVIRLHSPHGWVRLGIKQESPRPERVFDFSLFRAGDPLLGSGLSDPTRGWTSPTYGVKIPALSLSVTVESPSEIIFSTDFNFPNADK